MQRNYIASRSKIHDNTVYVEIESDLQQINKHIHYSRKKTGQLSKTELCFLRCVFYSEFSLQGISEEAVRKMGGCKNERNS